MRKLILAGALALVLLATQAFGGTYGNMTLGAKAGLNIAKFNIDDIVKEASIDISNGKSILGFCGGAFLELPINGMISFQPEVLYTIKGGKETIVGCFGGAEETWNLSYIEIPVLFKAYLPMAPAVKPHLYVGPEVAFRVSATVEKKDLATGETLEEVIDGGATTDVGIVFGGGVAFPTMARTFSFEARYNVGLTNIDEEMDLWDMKNGVVSILAGVAF